MKREKFNVYVIGRTDEICSELLGLTLQIYQNFIKEQIKNSPDAIINPEEAPCGRRFSL